MAKTDEPHEAHNRHHHRVNADYDDDDDRETVACDIMIKKLAMLMAHKKLDPAVQVSTYEDS